MEKIALDLARKKLYFCKEDDPVQKVADLMQAKNVGSVLVKDSRMALSGIVTVGDILRLVSKKNDISKHKVKDIMSSPVMTAKYNIDLMSAMQMFKKTKVTRLVLVDDKGKELGVLRELACYKCLTFSKFEEEAAERFSSYRTDHFY